MMNEWIAKDRVLEGSLRNLKIPEGYDKDEVPDKTVLADDGVEAEMSLEAAQDLHDFVDRSNEDMEV